MLTDAIRDGRPYTLKKCLAQAPRELNFRALPQECHDDMQRCSLGCQFAEAPTTQSHLIPSVSPIPPTASAPPSPFPPPPTNAHRAPHAPPSPHTTRIPRFYCEKVRDATSRRYREPMTPECRARSPTEEPIELLPTSFRQVGVGFVILAHQYAGNVKRLVSRLFEPGLTAFALHVDTKCPGLLREMLQWRDRERMAEDPLRVPIRSRHWGPSIWAVPLDDRSRAGEVFSSLRVRSHDTQDVERDMRPWGCGAPLILPPDATSHRRLLRRQCPTRFASRFL